MNKNKKEQPNEIDFFKTICKILDDCYYVCLITKKKKSVLNIAIKNIELKKDENLHEFPNFLKSEDSNKVYVDNILYLRDQIDKDIKIHCDKSFKKVYLSKNKGSVYDI
ncbi:MAG: hypothetical protein ACRQFF_13630 [Sphaerochaeta sp.]